MHPNKANFVEGLRIILTSWHTFRLAVENEWGGHQSGEKAEWFLQSLVEHFDERGRKVDLEEVEDILLDVLEREFNAVLEDGSEKPLAHRILALYQQCIKGETLLLQVLRAEPVCALQSIFEGESSGSDDDGNHMNNE